MHAASAFTLVLLAIHVTAGPLHGQTGTANGSDGDRAAVASGSNVNLIFEREVFVYRAANRRDPFTALVGAAEFGPRFEEVELRGIIYSERPDQRVALLTDPTGRIYRARQGQHVGNARVLEITPLTVRFAVENFGMVRQERLELKRSESEGAGG